jgi:hypothetical protein
MTDIQDYAKTIKDPKEAIKLAKAEIKEWQKLITILEKHETNPKTIPNKRK